MENITTMNMATSVPDANRRPPSPRGLPLIGNLHQLGSLPHRSLHALAAAHGPVMLIRLGQVPVVVVSSASAAREVLQAQDHVFASRPSLIIPRRLLYDCTDIAFAPPPEPAEGAGLPRREGAGGGGAGPTNSRAGVPRPPRRRLRAPERAPERFRQGRGQNGWHAKVDALLEETNVLLSAFHVGDYIPWLSWVSYVDGTDARVTRAFETIDRILDEIVDAAAARETPLSGEEASDDAFIHVLLSLQQEEPSPTAGTAEWRLSRDNVKALLEDLFGAGTEATIIVLEWAMAELLRNKEVMQKLQREVTQARSTSSDHSNIIGEQDLAGMDYLRAVIKETLRLHSPAPLLLPHKSMQATRISHGYDIPSDTIVIVNSWAIGRDPEAWESPEEFLPERFVGSGVDFRGQHFQLITFGAGRRMCPGVDFAMSVVELALANLVARFDWALPEGEAELDMQETAGVSSRKKAPLYAVATQRCFC